MAHLFDPQARASRFGDLPAQFYTRQHPTPLPKLTLAAWNTPLAQSLGIHADPLSDPLFIEQLAGSHVPADMQPLSSVYAGHQFGQFVPQLGDGRTILLAEHRTADSEIHELQLKGAGRTPYSRMGDGRAVLRSSIREYLCSEAMHALGIPSTRALSMVSSKEPVWREQLETAAVVMRVAPTFVRFGHFEFFAHRGDITSLRTLADWVITHFYPDCHDSTAPYVALLRAVAERTASLFAQWQGVGFCHGVLNSDNMSIIGLTLDYGPFGFMDGFNAGHVCNHSDTGGRYSWQNQPDIALWNLQCLAQALLPLADRDALTAVLDEFPLQFEATFSDVLRQKLGLLHWQEDDWKLAMGLLELMHQSGTDWTCFWRALAQFDCGTDNAFLRDLFIDRAAFDLWSAQYRDRLEQESQSAAERSAAMNRSNPAYVLRNHLAEQAIRRAETDGDFSEMQRLFDCLARPFDERPECADYAAPAPAWAKELSVSCSS